ncbi:hypothetical protein Pmani_007653 [Petrolisthes manimaculis]|uniref:Carboxylesterase type B domain-containing protein n=1 Tax=Petrolisthes manimaculis TaxID=1843537 RepID=A0AAE1UIG4_9EUCA|nr:hypothetical protein Pmani_007653 [Petrolisthes manimaculis]
MRLRLWLGVLALLHVLLHGGTQAHNNINNTPLQVQKSAAAINIPSPELVDTEDVNTKNTKEIETTDVNIPEIPLNTKNNVNTNMKIETTDVNIPEVPLNTKNNVNSKKIETLVDVNKKIETPVDVNKKIETPVDVNTKIETPVDVNKKIETPVDVNTKIETPVDVNSKKIETSFSVISKGVVRHRPPPPALRVTSTAPPVYHRLSVGDLGTVRGVVLKSLFGRDFYGFLSLPYAKPPVNDLRFKVQKHISYFGGNPDLVTVFGQSAGGASTSWMHLTPLTQGSNHLRFYIIISVLYILLFYHYIFSSITTTTTTTTKTSPPSTSYLHHPTTSPPSTSFLLFFLHHHKNLSTIYIFPPPLPQPLHHLHLSSSSSTTTTTTASNNGGRQLLHRVIPQSGSALEVWTLDDTPLQSFQNTAQVLECWNPNATTSTTTTTTTTQDIVACMRDKSFQEVVNASNIIYTTDRMAGGLGFRGLCPVVQTSLVGSGLEMVIPKPPQEIIAAGEFLHVPVMSGSVRDEGSLVLGWLKEENGVVANSMRLSYLPNAEMGNWYSMIGGMVDMGGVMFLKSGLWELATTAQQAVNNLTVFFYSFEFESADDSLFEWIFISHPDIPVEGGVCHADELLYLFHLPLDADSREATMVRRLTLLWSNFAKYGNPTPANHTEEESWEGEVEEWLPFTADVPNFMLIEDHFTLQVDYPTRWNYHLNNTKESLTKPPSPSPTTITTTTTEAGKHEYNNTVSRDEYEAVVGRMGDFKIASGVLGGLCGMLLILFVVVLVIKGRRTGEGVV